MRKGGFMGLWAGNFVATKKIGEDNG